MASLPLHRSRWAGQGLQAGVLVALTDESVPKVLLGRRALHLRLHPGEIAFPGGKREAEDHTTWDTALREAWEEVGIPASLVVPLGELPPLVTRSNFHLYPCVARVPADLALQVDYGEFASVFWAKLSLFADPQLFRLESVESDGRMRPHYTIGDDEIFGVTAAVLAMLANLAYDAGFDLQRDWENTP